MSVPPRTKAVLVRDVLQDNYGPRANGTLPSLDAPIATASMMMDRVAACATNKGITLSSTELELIERWLAAHFYAISDPIYISRNTAAASGQFQTGTPGAGLEATEYGRQAIAMDYSFCLGNLSKRERASAFWLGKPPSQQIPYTQRN